MTKIQKINLIGTILLLGFCVSSYLYYVLFGSYLNLKWPHNTFLFIQEDRFNDFFNVLRSSEHRESYLHDSALSNNPAITSNYFPFLYIIMYGLGLLGTKTAFHIYLVSLVLMMFYLSCKFLWKNEKLDLQTKLASFGIVLFSYPFLFCVDRGNVESFIFIFTGFFLLSFLKERYKTAAVFIAMAASLKLYPCILAWLFIKKKQYKACILSGVLTVVISVISLYFLHGGIVENFHGMVREMGHFVTHYTLHGSNGISLLAICLHIEHFASINIGISSWYTIFNICAVAILPFIICYIIKFESALWKQTFMLFSFVILFMGTSFDYKMITLLLSLFLFINTQSSNFDKKYCILFAILFIPKQLTVLINGYHFSIDDTIDALLIAYINFLIIKEGLTGKTLFRRKLNIIQS